MTGSFLHKIHNLFSNEDGSIVIETALVTMFIGFFAIGIIDFGLAYARSMELSNAVRAGVQYSTVRKPVGGDLSAIEAAIKSAVPSSTASSNQILSVTLYCQCADGTASDCLGTGGVDLSCDDGSARQSYLSISLTEDFTLLFPYPDIGSSIQVGQSATVRLN